MAIRRVDLHPSLAAGRGGSGWGEGLRTAFARWLERLREERRYRQAVRDLKALSDRELADIGIVRGQIREIARAAARRQR